MSEPANPAPPPRGKKKGSLEELGGMLLPLLVVSLVFGEEPGGVVFVAAMGVVAALVLLDARFRARLVAMAQRPDKPLQKGMGLAIPMVVMGGVFGGPYVLAAIIVILTVLGVLSVFGGLNTQADLLEAPPETVSPSVPQLPAQAQGETVSPLDVRSLCRDLPSNQAGEVITTIDYLEKVLVEAERQGNTRTAYDARQALHEYLPGTVEAWKAQAPQDRHPEELDRALDEVRAIAGVGDSSALRRAWETQQRFLQSRAPQRAGEGPPRELDLRDLDKHS